MSNFLQPLINIVSELAQITEEHIEHSADLKDLVKDHTNIAGDIQEVTRFETGWNRSMATIITQTDDEYWVFLGLIDRFLRNSINKIQNNEIFIFPKDSNCNKWGIAGERKAHELLEDAQEEAEWLRETLNTSDNPILVVFPMADKYFEFDRIICEP